MSKYFEFRGTSFTVSKAAIKEGLKRVGDQWGSSIVQVAMFLFLLFRCLDDNSIIMGPSEVSYTREPRLESPAGLNCSLYSVGGDPVER